MLMGYRRISPDDQTLDLQTEALNQVGCNRIFTDITTEPGTEQPGLNDAIAYLRPGDVLTVWQLDRVGKPLKQLLEFVANLNDRDIGFKSLEEDLDTRNYDRAETLRVLRALVKSEQQVIAEKTRMGVKRAKARGKKEDVNHPLVLSKFGLGGLWRQTRRKR